MKEILLLTLIVSGHILFWLVVAACFLLVPLGLWGTWGMVVAAAVYALCTGFEAIGWWDILGLTVAAGVGELIEFLGGLAGAKYYGATRWGMVGAMVGGIAGAILGTFLIPIPIVGSIVGAFLLCFGATVGVEYYIARDIDDAVKAGFGAFLGKVVSTVAKTAIALAMVVWMVWRIYFA